ncbi:hypothetical protein B0H14DRAFT_3722657 [Mycena olivaceomarginata]|nr:hypothetical protein B0H14DRAFT_3722657 [Mycena olivaceomarginata]
MSPTLRFAREFLICVCLSFTIILGAIHAVLHLLHVSFISGALRSPLARVLVKPIVQIAQISLLHEYLMVVILVFAMREVLITLLSWVGCVSLESEARELEARDRKRLADLEGQEWADAKSYYTLSIPAPGIAV